MPNLVRRVQEGVVMMIRRKFSMYVLGIIALLAVSLSGCAGPQNKDIGIVGDTTQIETREDVASDISINFFR